MPVKFSLSAIGQIALKVQNIDVAEKFYESTLGLRKLYRFGNLVFFDCAGVRLMVDQEEEDKPSSPAASVIYFRTADIALTARELKSRGVSFIDEPHLIAPMPDHDLWMTFFKDPSGNLLALMCEAPKGYQPAA